MKHKRRVRIRLLLASMLMIAGGAVSTTAFANAWVIGEVSIVEDYRSFDPVFGILVTLENKRYYSGDTSPSVCTQRFRIVVGQEGVTTETQKNFFAMLLAARVAGDAVRLYVNPQNMPYDGYCAVQIVSIGDV